MSTPQQEKRKVTVQKQKGVDAPEPAKSKDVKEVKNPASNQKDDTLMETPVRKARRKGTKLVTTEKRVKKLLRGKTMLEKLRSRVHYRWINKRVNYLTYLSKPKGARNSPTQRSAASVRKEIA